MDGLLGLSRATGLLLFSESYATNHGFGQLSAPVDVLQLSSSLFAMHHQLDHENNPDDSNNYLRWIAKENVWIFFFVTDGEDEDSVLLVLTISRGFDWEEAATWTQRLIAKILTHGPEKKVLRDFHCIDWMLHDYLDALIHRNVLFVLLYIASSPAALEPSSSPLLSSSETIYQTWLAAEMRLNIATGTATTNEQPETAPSRGSFAGNAWNKAMAMGSNSFRGMIQRGRSLERPNTKQTADVTTSSWCYFGFDASFVLKISDCDDLMEETNTVWSDRNKSAHAEEEKVIDDERGDAHRGLLRILRQQTSKHPASKGLKLDLIEYHTSGRARVKDSSNDQKGDDSSGLLVRLIIGHTHNQQQGGQDENGLTVTPIPTPLLIPSRLRHMCLLGATCLQQSMLPQFVAANPKMKGNPNTTTTTNIMTVKTNTLVDEP